MRRRFSGHLILLALVSTLLIVLATGLAQQSGALGQLDLLVDVRHLLVDAYVEKPDQEKMVQSAVRGMIQSLEDPHTSYLTAEDLERFDQYVTGTFSGIGAEVDQHQQRLRIVTPLEDSPAWKAGILAGDIVLEIEGESTLDMELTEAVQLLTGEPGTKVSILVRHESGEEEQVTITRDVINVQTVRGFQRDADQDYEFLIDDEQGIGYVRLTQFNDRTAKELRQALQSLKEQDARGLILDLRFNSGGLLESAVEVSDMFLGADEMIVSVKGRVVPEEAHQATDQTVLADLPIVVLANEASASAAEIVTGALKDNDRALFVGTRTFGKGSVQQVRMLENGQGALKMTTAYYYIPSGRLIHRREDSEVWGVDPSAGCYVPMKPEQVREMIELRRQSDHVRQGNGQQQAQVTPAWINEHLKDPQLAGALRAMHGKLSSGDWPAVGESNVEALVEANKRANLETRRAMLREQLVEVEQELGELSGTEAMESADASESTEGTRADRQRGDQSKASPSREPSLQGQP